MAISFEKTAVNGGFPAIWRGECRVLPGGFLPSQTFPNGTLVRRGTALEVDFDKMSASVVKVASVLTGGTTTEVRISKFNSFVAGDSVAVVGDTTVATVSSVDTDNDSYDVLTLSAALENATEGAILQEVDESGNALYTPNAVLGSDVYFDGKGLPTLDAAYDAVVLKKVVGAVPDSWLQGIALKNNPNIIYINQ